MALQENPQAWAHVDAILETSTAPNTKFFALKILEDTIKYRWKALPPEQRDGVKNYLVTKIIQLSKDDATLARERLFVGKLNLSLVHVLKMEWPHNWPSFISDIVGSSKTSPTLCENNMHILKLLSEEVFDYSRDEMTTQKIRAMKESLNKEFRDIFELCLFVLQRARQQNLLRITLRTLLRFLSWIPLGFVFETPLIQLLLTKFFGVQCFRNDTLSCLTEIGSLRDVPPNYKGILLSLYLSLMDQLVKMIPPDTNIAQAFANGSDEDRIFVQHLSLFFTGYFRQHLAMLQVPAHHNVLLQGMAYLVQISRVNDVEVFKICLEYWNRLAGELYDEECRVAPQQGNLLVLSPAVNGGAPSLRKALYGPVLTNLRTVMISQMAKPEEVLVVEDENGEIVRETTKDTDAIAQYKTMRETLVYLTHLDVEDTENIMLEKLSLQCEPNSKEWSFHNLNTLCWAIGSISGAMKEDDEKRFLVTVIKDLLGLCEQKRGKNNKAVIASNIMYVVGQYPRFLRAHWKFLKTVVNKLFEFMHELHPGVQDMACDTYLKIAQKCRRKFVKLQAGEARPFIEELLANLPSIVSDLESHQIHAFYESCAFMVGAQRDTNERDNLLRKLMELPNNVWQEIMARANHDVGSLKNPAAIKEVAKILRTNVRVCMSLGHPFISQMGRIYLDMLNVYKAYSEYISHAVETEGRIATKHSLIRAMRSVKTETLTLIRTFVLKSEDTSVIIANFIPPLLDPVLDDYKRSIADARDPAVLSLFAAVVHKLKGEITSGVLRILDSVFESTLSMITLNFEDHPEHRINFFRLLEAIIENCFPVFFTMDHGQQKRIVDSVVWAFKHTERNIAATGLNILHMLLRLVEQSAPNIAQGFYQVYLLPLLQDVLYVLTDRLHKSGFKMHATILRHIIVLVQTGAVTIPLWDTSKPVQPGTTNTSFLFEFIMNLISRPFQNVGRSVLQAFVTGLLDIQGTGKNFDTFKARRKLSRGACSRCR